VTRVVAGAILRGDDVLVCKRPDHKAHPGRWEFPGGKVEPGETLEQALRRELREELAIDADVGEQLWTTEHRYAGEPPVELHFFRVTAFRGVIAGDHFPEIRWQPLRTLDALDFLEADRSFVASLVRGAVRGA
jgi:8-oxo-dGTP diphosphatase